MFYLNLWVCCSKIWTHWRGQISPGLGATTYARSNGSRLHIM